METLLNTATETNVTTLSINGLGVVLKKQAASSSGDRIMQGTICWAYDSYIAFDLEKNEAVVCLNDKKQKITPYETSAFSFGVGEYLVRWRISNSKDGSLLTLVLWGDNNLKATLVVSVSGEHVGFEMTANLRQSLELLCRHNKQEWTKTETKQPKNNNGKE